MPTVGATDSPVNFGRGRRTPRALALPARTALREASTRLLGVATRFYALTV